MNNNKSTARSRYSSRSESPESRFWKRVQKNGTVPEFNPSLGQCWEWMGGKDSKGYGRFRPQSGVQAHVHRFAFELENGPIPNGTVIDHTCQNPGCVRPAHLRSANRSQNGTHRVGANSNSTTGERGVWRRGNRFEAGVKHNGQAIRVGMFDTLQAAAHAVRAKRLELFGGRAGR